MALFLLKILKLLLAASQKNQSQDFYFYKAPSVDNKDTRYTFGNTMPPASSLHLLLALHRPESDEDALEIS
jgi:hypothetical protein